MRPVEDAADEIASLRCGGASTADLPRRVELFDPEGKLRPFEVLEAEIYCLAVIHSRYSVTRAARALGAGRSTIYRKLVEAREDLPWSYERAAPGARQQDVLDALDTPRTAQELGAALGASKQSISALIARLMDARLVRRVASNDCSARWAYVRCDAPTQERRDSKL